MTKPVKNYKKITPDVRNELEETYYLNIVANCRREQIKENFHKYEVILQDLRFVTYITEDELRLSIKLSIDLLEELKEINNNGMNRQAYEQLIAESTQNENKVLQTMYIWNKIKTDHIHKLLTEIDKVQRVGGSWAVLFANPCLIDAICAVYERLVDQFDDEELYALSGYFLLRAIMRMHSDAP